MLAKLRLLDGLDPTLGDATRWRAESVLLCPPPVSIQCDGGLELANTAEADVVACPKRPDGALTNDGGLLALRRGDERADANGVDGPAADAVWRCPAILCRLSAKLG